MRHRLSGLAASAEGHSRSPRLRYWHGPVLVHASVQSHGDQSPCGGQVRTLPGVTTHRDL